MKNAKTMAKVAVCAVALVPASATGQRLGTVELAGFGRYTALSVDRPIDNAVGVGGALGIYFSNRFKVTADGSYTPSASTIDVSDVAYTPYHFRLVYELPLSSSIRAVLGAGYVYNRYTKQSPDNGIGNLLGLRVDLSDQVSVFTQLAQDWMPPGLNPRHYIIKGDSWERIIFVRGLDVHHGLEAGLSARFGGRAPVVMAITEPVRPPMDRVEPARQQTQPPPTQQVLEKAAEPPAAPERFVTLEPVSFEFDRWELQPQVRAYLLRVAAILRVNPAAGVLIEGHTDRRGTDQYNQALALKRATVVRQFLIEQNVDAGRLDTASQGEKQPADPASTEQAYARNRRVEFRLPAETRLREPR